MALAALGLVVFGLVAFFAAGLAVAAFGLVAFLGLVADLGLAAVFAFGFLAPGVTACSEGSARIRCCTSKMQGGEGPRRELRTVDWHSI